MFTPAQPKTRNQYSVEFKIRVAQAYNLVRQPRASTSLDSMIDMVANDYGVSRKSVLRWHDQWLRGSWQRAMLWLSVASPPL